MKFLKYIIFFLPVLFLFSCEREIEIELPDSSPRIVVEGFIENGMPPYVILTRSAYYFDEFNFEKLQELFVRNAKVTVSDGVNTWDLPEFTIDTADGVKFHVYANPFVAGEAGKTYFLRIEVEGEVLTAQTTIPIPVAIDSLWIEPHPNPTNDTLKRVMMQLSDPPGVANYYKYFTSVNRGPYLKSFNPLFDDQYVDGLTFKYPIDRGVVRGERVDFDNYYFFKIGDTITVKWSSIDKQHYDFWRSADYQGSAAGNPFSGVTRINSNIVGGLGIWGGYGSSFHTIIAE